MPRTRKTVSDTGEEVEVVEADANEPTRWVPPTTDQEFTFSAPDSLPGWGDPGWRSWDNGPALALPAGDLYGDGPYHTKSARLGSTVKFIAGNPRTGAAPRFEVIEGEVDEDAEPPKRAAQQSAAALEDLLKTGYITPADLDADAKSQVASRSPGLRPMIEEAM